MIQIDQAGHGVFSLSMKLTGDDQEFLAPGAEEFSFYLNGKFLNGTDPLKLVSLSEISG